MTAQILKRLFVSLLIVVLGAAAGLASDDETKEKSIELKPVVETTGPFKPKAPALLRLSAYYDGDAVVITSNVDILAQVSIFDTASGQTYYNSVVAIAPQCRCQIAPTSAMLTLQITVGDTVYEGMFTVL